MDLKAAKKKRNAVVPANNNTDANFNHMTLTTVDSDSELNNLGRASRKYAGSVLEYAGTTQAMSPPLPLKGPHPTPQLMSENSEGATSFLDQKISKQPQYTPTILESNLSMQNKKMGVQSFLYNQSSTGSLLLTNHQQAGVTKSPILSQNLSNNQQLLQLQVNRQSSHSITNNPQHSPGGVAPISTHSLSPKTGIYPTTYGQPTNSASVGLLAAKAKRLSGQVAMNINCAQMNKEESNTISQQNNINNMSSSTGGTVMVSQPIQGSGNKVQPQQIQVKKRYSRNQVQSAEEVLITNKKRQEEELLVVTEADFSDDEGHKTLAGGGGSTGNIKPVGNTNDTTSYGTIINGSSALGAMGGGMSHGTQQPPQFQAPVIQGPKRRKDRLGNVINQGVQKRWQVTFRDTISKGQAVATYHEVESYKEFNKMDDDIDSEIETGKKRTTDDKNEACACSIF